MREAEAHLPRTPIGHIERAVEVETIGIRQVAIQGIGPPQERSNARHSLKQLALLQHEGVMVRTTDGTKWERLHPIWQDDTCKVKVYEG